MTATPIATAGDDRSIRLTGIGLMLAGVGLFSFNDALGKYLVATYSVGQLLLLRAFVALVLLSPFIWRARAEFKAIPRPGLQLLRVVLSAGEVAAFFFATIYLPLADVITFYMAAPIFVTALSALVLGEHVGWRRWTAVAVGFCGVLIALKPSTQTVSWPALIALGGSLAFAVLMVVTRFLRGTSDMVLASSQFAAALLLGAVWAPFAWVSPGAARSRPVCLRRLHLGGGAALRQPLAQARRRKRRGAVPVHHDRLGGAVRLPRVRRRAVDQHHRRRRGDRRRRSLHLPARTQARVRRDAGQHAAGVITTLQIAHASAPC